MCEYLFLFVLCQNVMYYCTTLSTVFDWICALQIFIISIIISIFYLTRGSLVICRLESSHHKGLYQGCQQASVYFQVILTTSHKTTQFCFYYKTTKADMLICLPFSCKCSNESRFELSTLAVKADDCLWDFAGFVARLRRLTQPDARVCKIIAAIRWLAECSTISLYLLAEFHGSKSVSVWSVLCY